MPENYIELPDTKKLVVFETDQHPDFPATSVNVQEILTADIPTYTAVADGISTALNKNIISIFNNLPTKRIRVQEVYLYPKALANITVTFQLGYINEVPTGGTDITINRYAADFAAPPAAPDTVIAQSANTSPAPLAGVLFGGVTANLNAAGKFILFEAKRNTSSLQLRPTLDGLCVRQTAGSGTTATVTAHVVFTLD